MSLKIWANVLVKNEDRYLWFAVSSVVDFVDQLLIWDTGSEDKTLEIISLLKEKYPDKIIFAQKGSQDSKGITSLRQQMLEQSKCDWILLLDGDEIWWRSSLEKVVKVLNSRSNDLYAVVNPVFNLVGDIYHYQPESAGQYNLLGKKGHFNIRFINRKIPGLHIKGTYPLEGFYDQDQNIIQQQEDRLEFVNGPLLHCTHLSRSTLSNGDIKAVKRAKKRKYELGRRFRNGFDFPEVLSESYPEVVPNPWNQMSLDYKLKAAALTPFRLIKRMVG